MQSKGKKSAPAAISRASRVFRVCAFIVCVLFWFVLVPRRGFTRRRGWAFQGRGICLKGRPYQLIATGVFVAVV